MDGAGRMVMESRRKKISDYLADDSDGADEPVVLSRSPPETPRLRSGLPAMFTCAGIRFVGRGRKGRRGGGRRKEVLATAAAAEKCEASASSVDSSGGAGSNAGSSSGGSAGGMGMGLLFLLARTCVELNKMAEVRAQMEALLEEMRDKLSTTKAAMDNRHRAHPEPPRTIRGGDLLPWTASPCRAPPTETDDGRAGLSSSSTYMETASSDADGAARTDAVGAGRRRYQLNCNSEQETSESSSDDGEFIELDVGFGASDRLGGRHPAGDGEGDEEEEEVVNGGEGVSALELERRLHELLHRRSRQRTEELEASLRRAERKLVEKEMEARLWKDTAELALQPPP